MQKEVLIYGQIDDYSAGSFITALGAIGDADFTSRINTNGGNVKAGWGMIAKYSEMPGNKVLKVDGAANSMGAYFACYAADVECLDITTFGFHRAAYAEWIEESPVLFDNAARAELKTINAHLRKAMEAKLDIPAFEAIAGCSLDEFFSLDGRIEVSINAQQAKKIRLVNSITKITPQRKASIEAKMIEITALQTGLDIAAKAPIATPQNNNQKNKIMTAAEIKAQFPDVYNEIFAAGATNETERVSAWMEFNDIDAEAVASGIKDGKSLGQKEYAEFTRKGIAQAKLEGLKEDSAKDIKTADATNEKEVTAEVRETNAFLTEARKTYLPAKEAK